MPLTDKTRAAVFARDKGICAFSGVSLWMLDYGTAPFGHPDWPDHVVPASRGGKDTLDNLVCASFFQNSKKRNNGSDKSYLFLNGVPTEDFYWTHGELSEVQAEVLRCHACIQEPDWYFNRALFNIRVALNNEANGAVVRRGRDYWLASAAKRLATWRTLSDDTSSRSFVRRGLVRYPASPDVRLMLSLANAEPGKLVGVYRSLLRHYRANRTTLDRFCRARTERSRAEVVAAARRHPLTTEPLMQALTRNAARLRTAAESSS